MSNKNSSLIGFALAGLAAGAAAWYLFGTKEGRETLDKAVDGFNEFSHKVKDRANDGLEYAASYAEKAKEKAKQTFEQGRNQFSDATDELKDRAGQKANRLKNEAEELGRQAGHSADNLIDDANNKINS